MCLESRDRAAVVMGTLVVKSHDNLFWFGRPQMLLYLMYFILFRTHFRWHSSLGHEKYKLGLRSCFHRKTDDIVTRIVVGMVVQYLCGYVTLPLYALVTYMGSSMKEAVFTEQVVVGLIKWHNVVKGKVNAGRTKRIGTSPYVSISVSSREAF